MTQPPDERDPQADKTPDPDAPEDQPTIAWTPGDASIEPPPSDASMPPGAAPPAGDLPPAQPPSSPIISASPAGVPTEPTGWQQPGWQQPGSAPAGPVVSWESPSAAAPAAGAAGYVISGMGARIVAYLLDSFIVSIVPIFLSLFVIDWSQIFDQASTSTGRAAALTMEVTPQLILVTLIGFAIEFIYFVGFWTSGGQATPGMRLLKMKVADFATGGILSLTDATKRFVALGAPLSLLALIPALQSVAGVAEFALLLFLFFTAITNDRRQGLHDKWANSLVIRSTTSGDGATLVGCLLLIVIVFVVGIVAGGLFLAAVGPDFGEFMRRAIESARPVAP